MPVLMSPDRLSVWQEHLITHALTKGLAMDISYKIKYNSFYSNTIEIDIGKKSVRLINNSGEEIHLWSTISDDVITLAIVKSIKYDQERKKFENAIKMGFGIPMTTMRKVNGRMRCAHSAVGRKCIIMIKHIINATFCHFGVMGVERRLCMRYPEVCELWEALIAGKVQYPQDLVRVPSGYARYLLERIINREARETKVSEGFLTLIKKCKFPIKNIWENADRIVDISPKTKWDWYMCHRLRNGVEEIYKIKSWSPKDTHLAKKLGIIPNGYCSKKNVFKIGWLIDDTAFALDNVGLPVPTTNTQMLKTSVEYHNYDSALRKEILRRLALPFDMPRNGCPDELEPYRIKTSVEMIAAGQECHHCIGGMAKRESKYIFLRKEEACAQIKIDNDGLSIIQCFGKFNKVTKESQELFKIIQEVGIKYSPFNS